MAEQSFHVRSISMPSRSHPTIQRINEELHNLQNCEVAESSSPSTSSSSTEVACKKLRCLRDVHNDIQDLLHVPSNQQFLGNSNQWKWLEEEVDGSLAMLDLCDTMKNVVTAFKEQVQDLQLALRRKSNISIKREVQTLRKEMQKIMKKYYKELKKLQGKSDLSNLEAFEKLHEAREFTISVLLSVLSSMSITRTKSNKWSFASKIMLKKRIECETNLVERNIDILAIDDYSTIAHDQLEGTKISLSGLENELESLHRALIQHRVSILNIFSM